MDLDFLNDVKEHAPNFEKFSQVSDILRCPKCETAFIEDNKCQACGYNLDFNLLGDPLGEKSFYTIREKYWESLTLLERENYKFFKDEVKFKHYINKIKLRYNDLLDFFYSNESIEDQNRALYLHELRDLVIELMEHDIHEDEIWSPLNEKHDMIDSGSMSLYDQIKSVVSESKRSRRKNRRYLFSSKLGERISISNLVLAGLILTLLVGLSLAYLSYKQAIT